MHKILIVQLARLGDIYQSWPAVRALRRANPDAEIHFLGRPRFLAACSGLEAVDRVIALPSRDALAPLLEDRPNIPTAALALSRFLSALRAEGYRSVINLTFSPFSSYVATAAAGPGTEIRGYARHSDGHLSIPDDASAYFYAQTGPGRENRVHLTDLFALVAGVDLALEDWIMPSAAPKILAASGRSRVVVHIGASDTRKTLSPHKWAGVARALMRDERVDIELVGAPSESAIGAETAAQCANPRLTNLVGSTTLEGLFQRVQEADLLIGGDSGPMQIASLTGTPALCLSLPSVSFWETGPRSAHSRIFPISDESDVGSDAIADEAIRILDGRETSRPAVVSAGPTFPYVGDDPRATDRGFTWSLQQAIYMGSPFPPPPDELFLSACQRLQETNGLALAQLQRISVRPDDETARTIFRRADELFSMIGRFEPRAAPIVRWFETERVRVGPMSREELVSAYRKIHGRLGDVLAVYSPAQDLGETAQEAKDGVQDGI